MRHVTFILLWLTALPLIAVGFTYTHFYNGYLIGTEIARNIWDYGLRDK